MNRSALWRVTRLAVAGAVGAMLLSACGGGGGSSGAPVVGSGETGGGTVGGGGTGNGGNTGAVLQPSAAYAQQCAPGNPEASQRSGSLATEKNWIRAYFDEGERRFGVHWELLAAVMLIETRMGRIVSNSSAGAQGPMQFIPSTWAAYGLGGDVRDPHDAVLGAANYLSAKGAPGDDRNALFHYNPVPSYVIAVTRYAKAMERDPDLFYAYYNWQVFVRTTRGDVRLTGPGL